jgi:hypothetical protein
MFYVLDFKMSICNILITGKDKSKGKIYPRTAHEDPEWELRYNSTLSLTSTLDVGGVSIAG